MTAPPTHPHTHTSPKGLRDQYRVWRIDWGFRINIYRVQKINYDGTKKNPPKKNTYLKQCDSGHGCCTKTESPRPWTHHRLQYLSQEKKKDLAFSLPAAESSPRLLANHTLELKRICPTHRGFGSIKTEMIVGIKNSRAPAELRLSQDPW